MTKKNAVAAAFLRRIVLAVTFGTFFGPRCIAGEVVTTTRMINHILQTTAVPGFQLYRSTQLTPNLASFSLVSTKFDGGSISASNRGATSAVVVRDEASLSPSASAPTSAEYIAALCDGTFLKMVRVKAREARWMFTITCADAEVS